MFEINVSLQCFSKTNLSLFGFSQFDKEIFVLVVVDNVLFYEDISFFHKRHELRKFLDGQFQKLWLE